MLQPGPVGGDRALEYTNMQSASKVLFNVNRYMAGREDR